METVVVAHPYIQNLIQSSLFFDFELCKQNISIALIDLPSSINYDFFLEKSVLVQIEAFSCNYRDITLMLEFNRICRDMSNSQEFFYTGFGSEFVATVLEVGKEVKSLKVGDRVIPDGAFPLKENNLLGGLPTNSASQRIQIFHESQLMKVPDSMPNEIAAAFTISGQTIYSMIRKLNLEVNANVLITSATSNTSLAAIQVLKNKKVNVFVLSSNSVYEKDILQLGVKKYIPYVAVINNSIKEYIGDVKFDAIIDPFFDIYMNRVVDYIKLGGKYIYCGFYKQYSLFDKLDKSDDNFFKTMVSVMSKNISIIGNCLGEKNDLKNAIKDFENNKYKVLIDSVYSGDSILPFLEKSFNKVHRFGKVVYRYE